MPVPTLTAPSVQPEAQPTQAEPVPQLGAFSNAHLGEGLTQIGKEIWGIGWEEYHKAAEAFAQEKENEFMGRALRLRDEYRNMYNGDAIGAHEKYRKSLEQARADIGATISSKYGLSVYNNNSLRRAGLVQESMDSHFEVQNRQYQKLQYDVGQEVHVRTVAALATDVVYNAKNVEYEIDKMWADAHRRGLDVMGLDAKTAWEFATEDTHKATDALFKVLLDPKSGRDPELVQSELDKYKKKGMLDAGRMKDAQHALGGTEAAAWVARTLAGFKRVDASGAEDPEGRIPYASLVKARNSIGANDPNRLAKIDKLRSEFDRERADYDKAGAEMEGKVVAKGSKGGSFAALPEEDPDWQKFKRLYPVQAMALDAKTSDRLYRVEQRDQRTIKQASHSAFGAVRLRLDQMQTDDVKRVTEAQVSQWMRDEYHVKGRVQPEPEDSARALEYLKKLQTGKLDPVERKFHQIAYDALSDRYKGNRAKISEHMNMAHYILDDAYSASQKLGKPLSENDLREKLVGEFTKKGGLLNSSVFGSRSGETYVRRPKDAVLGHDGNWYVPVAGKPGSFVPWRSDAGR